MALSQQQELLETYGDQLRSKISSKFSASTFLAGFAGAILTSLLTSLYQKEQVAAPQLSIALALATAATVLFVHGIVRLDELSMPKRFWPSRPDATNRAEDVGLLTQDDLWALHDRMVFFWRHLTLRGTFLTGLGLLFLLLPPVPVEIRNFRELSFTLVLAGTAAALLYVRWLDGKAPHRDRLIRPVD